MFQRRRPVVVLVIALSLGLGMLLVALAVLAFYIGYRKGRYDERGDRSFAEIMRRRYGS